MYHAQRSHHPADPYWFSNDPSVLTYQQQQYNTANAAAPQSQPQNPQLQYSNQAVEPQHEVLRQDFSNLPAPNMAQSPSTYHHISTTYPQLQRSMTTPSLQNQSSGSSAGTNIHIGTHSGTGQEQYTYNPAFPTQPTQQSQWYPPANNQQAFGPHYLPSQRDPRSDQSDWPG